MRLDHDVCRTALDSLQNEGVYFIDQNRLAIYYVGKESTRFSNIGLLKAGEGQITRCDSEIHAVYHTCPNSEAGHSSSMGNRDASDRCRDNEPLLEVFQASPVLTRISAIKNELGETVGAVQVFTDDGELDGIRQRLEELEKIVLVDTVTHIGNRRYAEIHLQCWIDEMARYGWPFGLLFLDVDHFKRINDCLGHAVGDEVLRMIGATLLSGLRSSDLVSRWGGEEFVVGLKNIGQCHLAGIAEKVRSLVEQSCVPTDRGLMGVTLSVGATLARRGDSVSSLIERADKLMYQSKKAGRNCVTIDSV